MVATSQQGSVASAGQRQWRDYLAQQCDSRAANNFLRVPTALTPGEDSSVRVRRELARAAHVVTCSPRFARRYRRGTRARSLVD